MSHGCHVEVNPRPEDLVARPILWRDLFERLRRIVEHSQLKIATRSKDMLLPIGFKKSRLLNKKQ